MSLALFGGESSYTNNDRLFLRVSFHCDEHLYPSFAFSDRRDGTSSLETAVLEQTWWRLQIKVLGR